MLISRRSLAALLPLLAEAQTKPVAPKPQLKSQTLAFEELPVKQNGTNSSRAIVNAVNHENFPFEMHYTELGPGKAPHPPHQHLHEEIVIVKEGMLDVTINEKTTKAGPGAIVFACSNDMHGWVNNTEGKTGYYVIAIGHDA